MGGVKQRVLPADFTEKMLLQVWMDVFHLCDKQSFYSTEQKDIFA